MSDNTDPLKDSAPLFDSACRDRLQRVVDCEGYPDLFASDLRAALAHIAELERRLSTAIEAAAKDDTEAASKSSVWVVRVTNGPFKGRVYRRTASGLERIDEPAAHRGMVLKNDSEGNLVFVRGELEAARYRDGEEGKP